MLRGSVVGAVLGLVGALAALEACASDADAPADTPASGASGGAGGAGGAAGASGQASGWYDPQVLGPYLVGNTTRMFVDESRDEPATTADTEDKRTLITEIWYPAAESERDKEKDKFTGFFGDQADTIVPLLAAQLKVDAAQVEVISKLRTGSVRDAKPSDAGPFPIVLFSHGNGGVRFQSIFLCEHLASHGYVVVSPDHTGNAALTQLPSGLVFPGPFGIDPLTRVADMSFLVDTLESLQKDDPDGRFTGMLDLERVGMTGHSFGGNTTLETVAREPRVKVGAPLAAPTPLAAGVKKPMMHFEATEDATIKADGNAAIEKSYADSEGPRLILRLVDAGHFSFSDICLLAPKYGDGCGSGERLGNAKPFEFLDWHVAHEITNNYETALFGLYLRGVAAYADDLQQNAYGADLELESDGVK